MDSGTSANLPVERLREGDRVQAVKYGPVGKVVDADRAGWTMVEWPKRSILSYKHGEARLMVVGDPEAADAYQAGLHEFSDRLTAALDAWDAFRGDNDLDAMIGFEEAASAIDAIRPEAA